MASFTESATLILIDEASKPAKEINAALKELMKTAKAFGKASGSSDKLTKNLDKADKTAKSLAKDLSKLKVNLNTTQATRALNQLGRKPVRVNILASAKNIAIGLGLHDAFRAGARLLHDAIVEGARQESVSKYRLNALVKPGDRPGVNAVVDQIQKDQQTRPGGATLNRFQTEQLVAESLPNLVGKGGQLKPDNAKYMVEQITSLIEQQVAAGVDPKQAVERGQDYVKAAISSGRLYDESGKFNKGEGDRFFDLMRKLQPVIGEEMTGPFVKQMLQNMPRLGSSTSDEGLAKILMMAEEQRTKIVTSLESLDNALFTTQRGATSPVNKNLIAAGFRTGTNKPNLDVHRAYKEDPFSIVPRFLDFMKKSGLDPTKNRDIEIAANRVAPTSRAGGALAELVKQAQALKDQFALVEQTSGKLSDVQDQTSQSILVAQMKMSNAFTGMAGQAVRSLEPVITPLMGETTKMMSDLSDQMAAHPELTAGGILGGGALLALQKSGVLKNIGLVSGLTGLMDPATRPLAAAGLSLDAAASDLSAAATALGGVPGGAGKTGSYGRYLTPGAYGVAAGAGAYALGASPEASMAIGGYTSLGATLGIPFGPFGIALGAAAGAVTGFATETDTGKKIVHDAMQSWADASEKRRTRDQQIATDTRAGRRGTIAQTVMSRQEGWQPAVVEKPMKTINDILDDLNRVEAAKSKAALVEYAQMETWRRQQIDLTPRPGDAGFGGDQKDSINQMLNSMDNFGTTLQQSFNSGGMDISSQMANAAPGWGASMSNGFDASGLGARFGNSAAAQLANIKVNVAATATPSSDTGVQTMTG